ncbi:MFS transporter [Phenylobacterium sp.]|jgi:Na+/melibiose symporter-like transporter|uniref:MFS transporter n=1 Tax=Phenylobacterium sp. TaxID=1871053 RepID=UPI002F957226
MVAKSPAAPAERLPLRTKLAFGIGSAAESLALYSVSSFALLFYNQVLGVPAGWVTLALSASLFFDALSDPVVGSLSDRTRSKWGRRHVYMYFAPLPVALCLFAIFAPPKGLGETGLAIWLAGAVILLRQAMTFFHTPHLALGGELSPHYTERSKVMAYNSFFYWAGGALTTFLALRIFFKATPEFPRGVLNPDPYPSFAFAISAAALVILFASAWFTKDRIPLLPKPAADHPGFSPREFIRDVWKALRNINYVWLLIGYFFLMMMIGLREGMRLFVYTFYWGLNSNEISLFILGSFVGYATAFLIAPRLHGKIDKKRTIIWAVAAYTIVPPIPLFLGIAGILTPETPGLLWILIAFAAVQYGAISVLQISTTSALADIADENELRFGHRQEGVLYSTRALAAKIDQAVGTALVGVVLSVIAFPEKAKPGSIPPETLTNLAWADSAVAMIPGFFAIIFYAKYNISRQSYEATRAALAARREGGGHVAATAPAE